MEGGGGGGTSKTGGGPRRKFSKDTLKVPEFRLMGVAQMDFTPKRYQQCRSLTR